MSNSRRIAIIGSGPIGIEAALYAATLGHDVTIFERADEPAANVRAWGFVTLFSPWSMNVTTLGTYTLAEAGQWVEPQPDASPTGREFRDRYLLPLARTAALKGRIRTRCEVITIGRDDFGKSEAIGSSSRASSPFRLLVRDDAAGARERVEHADIVLDCSGTYGHHRWAGRGGVPAPGERALADRIWYTIPDVLGADRARFEDRHTLLLGAGFSAATVLHDIEQLVRARPRTKLTWAIRRPGQALQALENDPLPRRRQTVLRSLELANHPPPWLQFLGTCVMEEIRFTDRFDVTLRHVQTNLAMSVDEVVALVGYHPDSALYEQLQVHQCYANGGPINLSAALLGEGAADCTAAGQSLGRDVLKNPEPNFYILGAKSYGTNSHFLLRAGHHQVRDVFQLIEQNPELNLYR